MQCRAPVHCAASPDLRTNAQDGDGHVSPQEFKQAILSSGVALPERQINALLRAIDRDASGKLEVHKFLDRFQVQHPITTPTEGERGRGGGAGVLDNLVQDQPPHTHRVCVCVLNTRVQRKVLNNRVHSALNPTASRNRGVRARGAAANNPRGRGKVVYSHAGGKPMPEHIAAKLQLVGKHLMAHGAKERGEVFKQMDKVLPRPALPALPESPVAARVRVSGRDHETRGVSRTRTASWTRASSWRPSRGSAYRASRRTTSRRCGRAST